MQIIIWLKYEPDKVFWGWVGVGWSSHCLSLDELSSLALVMV